MTREQKRDIIANILMSYDPDLLPDDAVGRALYILDALDVEPLISPVLDYEDYNAE